MESVLSIHGLTKQFKRIRAVDHLSLEVEQGSVFGLLGPNGSGKTTTLGMITGVIRPSMGYFEWFGKKPTDEDRKKVGAIIEAPLFYPYLTGIQNLKIVADIKGVDYGGIEDVLNFAGLEGRGIHKFRTYSLGMKQRLAIAAALLSSPQVLILDEPTNGLDPQGIAGIRELIRKVASQGTTIVLASHLLDEVQKVCSHVAILSKGKAVFSGRVEELTGKMVVELAADDMDRLEALCRKYTGAGDIRREGELLLLSLDDEGGVAGLNRYLAGEGMYVKHLVRKVHSLERSFMEKLGSQ